MPGFASGGYSPDSPFALFVGDFNTGKSSLINALLRRPLLLTERRESRALPTLIARGGREERYAGLTAAPEDRDADHGTWRELSYHNFANARHDSEEGEILRALAATVGDTPFLHLGLADTPGASSDLARGDDWRPMAQADNALLVLVVDVEYCGARHTLDFLSRHAPVFRERMLVLANKADRLNADEITRIVERAPKRLERHGVEQAVPILPVSARLELPRTTPENPGPRRDVVPDVRRICDAGFDAFRVALYEFELRWAMRHAAAPSDIEVFSALQDHPLMRALASGTLRARSGDSDDPNTAATESAE